MSEERKRVLFVCIGNACRSQMAEAFARAYGGDVLIPASAGLSPGYRVADDTLRAMGEKNLDLRDHFPKSIKQLSRWRFDLIINMSGYALPEDIQVPTIDWDVEDPVFMDFEHHCAVRDRIERLVMELIVKLRREKEEPHFRGQGSRDYGS